MNGLCRNGVLIGRTGLHANVLKIRPPMPLCIEEAELLVGALDDALGRVG